MRQDDLDVIILAGGKGTRLHPYTRKTPKVLLKIDDNTILERNIQIVRDKFQKREVRVVIGYNAQEIKEHLKNRESLSGIDIIYHCIPSQDIEKGFMYALFQLRGLIKKYFIILLGDEVYFSSDHNKMIEEMEKKDDFDVFCMLKKADSPEEILKNYSVEVSGDKIIALKEKPVKIINNYVGLGTIACSQRIFDFIQPQIVKQTPPHFIDFLNQGIQKGWQAHYFVSQCDYFNINNKDDLFHAKYFYRSSNIDKCSKSVIVPAYNEVETIGYVVKDFKKYVDEVIVMDNMSADGTADVARSAGARVFSRRFLGYGDAIRQGLEQAQADILIITEADFTFKADDLTKLLEYLKDADAVIGTRTHRSFIHDKANMGFFLRLGNIMFGKIISLLYWDRRCRLTDVGCTYRALWRSTYESIRDNLVTDGPEFSPEMMVEMLNAYLRLVEIPVKYSQRALGESKISISKWHSLVVAARMLRCILLKRTRQWIKNFKNTLSLILTK